MSSWNDLAHGAGDGGLHEVIETGFELVEFDAQVCDRIGTLASEVDKMAVCGMLKIEETEGNDKSF